MIYKTAENGIPTSSLITRIKFTGILCPLLLYSFINCIFNWYSWSHKTLPRMFEYCRFGKWNISLHRKELRSTYDIVPVVWFSFEMIWFYMPIFCFFFFICKTVITTYIHLVTLDSPMHKFDSEAKPLRGYIFNPKW